MGSRVQAIYSGRVQGVGFRYRVSEIAGRYPVTGYVRNLPDGTVELVAEGEEAVLDSFLLSIQERMHAIIHYVTVHRETSTGSFEEFQIRH